MNIFKACDIRGIAGDELNEDTARRIGRGLGTMMRHRGGGPVFIGGDFRRSTPALKQAVIEGLLEAGSAVRDAGQAATPIIYFAASRQVSPNAVIVTASHNPGRYNGVKFMVHGQPATPKLMHELETLVNAPEPFVGGGTVETLDVLGPYELQILPKAAAVVGADAGALHARRLKVVLDTMGGAFGEIAPRVLAAAGCEVIPIRATIDPDFAGGHPNPAVDDNLSELCQRVTAEGADLGIALDGDGDRATFVDPAGRIARPEQIGAILAGRCFRHPTVVYDLKCASVLVNAVAEAGGETIMQPSGHGYIKTMMIERHADLGVEVSGHFFFKALGGGDDGLFVSLVVAHLITRTGLALADLVEPIGWPAVTPDLRVPFHGDAAALLTRIAQHCGGEVSRMDGVRAQYEDGWALARSSITEPVLTLRFEGEDLESLRKVVARFLQSEPKLQVRVLETIR